MDKGTTRFLSVKEVINLHYGPDKDKNEIWDELSTASSVPPCCSMCVSRGAKVEPDGICEHGRPSLTLRLGLV